MKKRKATPPGYMSVGEIAGKLGVSVRTLQHYDRIGLFSPSAVSEGGRRLYKKYERASVLSRSLEVF